MEITCRLCSKRPTAHIQGARNSDYACHTHIPEVIWDMMEPGNRVLVSAIPKED